MSPLFSLLTMGCTGVSPSTDTTDDARPDDSTNPTETTEGTTTDQASTDTGTTAFLVSSPDMLAHGAGPCMQQLPTFAECGQFGGDNLNPRIEWSGVPAGTVSLALILDDVSFANPLPHWGAYDLDPTSGALEQHVSGTTPPNPQPTDMRETAPYAGSCSDGANTYRWRLAALDARADQDFGNVNQLQSWARDHLIAFATMCHCPENDCEAY